MKKLPKIASVAADFALMCNGQPVSSIILAPNAGAVEKHAAAAT